MVLKAPIDSLIDVSWLSFPVVICDPDGNVRAESAGVAQLLAQHGIVGPLASVTSIGALTVDGELTFLSSDGTPVSLLTRCHRHNNSIIVELHTTAALSTAAPTDLRAFYRLRGVARLAPALAHEARNASTSLVYNQHILADANDVPEEMRQACLEEIAAAARRLDLLIGGILDYAAPPHDDAEHTSVDEVLATLLVLVRNQFRTKRRALSIINSEPRLVAAIAPRDLELVLVELMLWATGAPQDEVRVVLQVSRASGSTVCFSVIADGRAPKGDEVELTAARWVTTQAGGTMRIAPGTGEIRVTFASA